MSAQASKTTHAVNTDMIDELNRTAYADRNRDPKLSLNLAEEALKLSEANNYKKGKAAALNNIGFYHLQLTEHEMSLKIFLEALDLNQEIQDETGIADTRYNLAALQLRFGNFDLALDALHKCISIREKQNDKAGLARCYFQMVYINEMFGNYEEGLNIGRKALAIQRELGDRIGIAALLTQTGAILRRLKKFDEAQLKLEEAMKLRGPQDEIRGYFATLFQWIELHCDNGAYDFAKKIALEHYEMALREKEWFGVMRFCQLVGKINMALGDVIAAKKYFEEGLKIAEDKKFKSITYEFFQLLSECYEREGSVAAALEYYKKFHQLKEEVLNAQSGSQLKSIQLMNQIDASRREAELERVKNVDLKNAFRLIEEKNKEILDSIHYASRIQRALITNEVYIERNLKSLKK